MSEIFTDEIKQALRYAERLQNAGEEELSKKLAVRCVRETAVYPDQNAPEYDVIELFYGTDAYDGIKNFGVATEYIYIAACAKVLCIEMTKNDSIAGGVTAWAQESKTGSDRDMAKFFRWLMQQKRRVSQNDDTYFRLALRALRKNTPIQFKVSSVAKQMNLFSIVEELVAGRMRITEKDELK